MRKKILIISTISGFVPQFEMNNVRILQKLNYEVHYASNFHTPVYGNDNKRLENTGVICHQVDFVKSPYKVRKNLLVYKQIKKLVQDIKFDLIHCHTPMGGAMGRLVAKTTNTRVIYTAHGFHFYKGGPLISWLIYYPIERYLSRYTDVLITINEEDFMHATRFNTCKIEKINGVGLHMADYSNVTIDKNKKRHELGIDKDSFVICSVGELNSNKNHLIVLKALKELKDKNLVYLICGNGNKKADLVKLSEKYRINKLVKFLGHRFDVNEILCITDCFIFPSKREGLGMAALEAMASGLPLIAADSRGTREYAINGKTGFIYKHSDYKGFSQGIDKLRSNHELRRKMGEYNKKAVEKFDIINVETVMERIYRSF